jgi:cytochrome c556
MTKPAKLHAVAKVSSVVATVLLMAGFSAPAQAQFAKPEDAVKYRQSALSVMSNHMGRINAQLKSPQPNVQVIQNSAALVETMSKLPWEAFVAGTENVGNTKALPGVFKDTAKIKELSEKLQAETAKLASVSKGGDVKAIQAQFGNVGAACKACHDDYRAK